MLPERKYSTSSCRWRGVKKQANSCHAACHFDSNALGGHKKKKKKKTAHRRHSAALMTVAALCFACYTNVPPAFPFCSNENCQVVPLCLFCVPALRFLLSSACTLFTLELTKKKKDGRQKKRAQIVATAQRLHSKRDKCKTH